MTYIEQQTEKCKLDLYKKSKKVRKFCMNKNPKIHDFCICSSIFAMPPLVSECLLDFGLINQNVSKKTKKWFW